jgi:hypothetical protein
MTCMTLVWNATVTADFAQPQFDPVKPMLHESSEDFKPLRSHWTVVIDPQGRKHLEMQWAPPS